jgi:hypothetical protein
MTDEQKARVQDIVRLVGAESDRNAFLALLAKRMQGREQLDDTELRHIAEAVWKEFLRTGWSKD